ncbi:hypothetical protein [Streptomyces solaniscabiei]|uniref:hypothetical protein n=1 Tax=Streptomyces solaniscabiei TaxID=2683255 RepID=UPI001CE2EC07|nr:hypothetical protein [Streptomyces solaniscabiei]
MSSPHDEELSHPLEQVTGEKDVHPEQEGNQDAGKREGSENDQAAQTPTHSSEDSQQGAP